jgi:hypothetical protein
MRMDTTTNDSEVVLNDSEIVFNDSAEMKLPTNTTTLLGGMRKLYCILKTDCT